MSVRILRTVRLAAILAVAGAITLISTAAGYVLTNSTASPEDIHASGTATVTLDITGTSLIRFCQNSDADRAEISLTPASVSYAAATSATNDLHRSMNMRR